MTDTEYFEENGNEETGEENTTNEQKDESKTDTEKLEKDFKTAKAQRKVHKDRADKLEAEKSDLEKRLEAIEQSQLSSQYSQSEIDVIAEIGKDFDMTPNQVLQNPRLKSIAETEVAGLREQASDEKAMGQYVDKTGAKTETEYDGTYYAQKYNGKISENIDKIPVDKQADAIIAAASMKN